MVIGVHFGGGDHFDSGDHFGGGTMAAIHNDKLLILNHPQNLKFQDVTLHRAHAQCVT